MDNWYRDFTLRTGLPHAERSVVWHQPPKHPMEAKCETWDCPALALDTGSLVFSAGSDLLLLGCTVMTEGGCLAAAITVKSVDAIITLGSFGYAVHEYYQSESSSDVDLAVALTDLASIAPGVGELSGIVSLGWDLADPFVDDEATWSYGRAK